MIVTYDRVQLLYDRFLLQIAGPDTGGIADPIERRTSAVDSACNVRYDLAGSRYPPAFNQFPCTCSVHHHRI